jgi:hypothetical protein
LGEDAQATGSQSPELSFQGIVETNEVGCGYAALDIGGAMAPKIRRFTPFFNRAKIL